MWGSSAISQFVWILSTVYRSEPLWIVSIVLEISMLNQDSRV